MSGFKFQVQPTVQDALEYLECGPLAFCDSLWLDTHLHLLRAAPARVIALYDLKAPELQEELARRLPAPGSESPTRDSVFGVPFVGPTDAAGFVTRRRELLSNALASATLGVGAQMDPFEMDLKKTH